MVNPLTRITMENLVEKINKANKSDRNSSYSHTQRVATNLDNNDLKFGTNNLTQMDTSLLKDIMGRKREVQNCKSGIIKISLDEAANRVKA